MKISEAYNMDPTLIGSAKMVAYYEALANVPHDKRIISPSIAPISVTSDGYVIANGAFLGSWGEVEDNFWRMAAHFDAPKEEVSALLANITDWRAGGNAYSR